MQDKPFLEVEVPIINFPYSTTGVVRPDHCRYDYRVLSCSLVIENVGTLLSPLLSMCSGGVGGRGEDGSSV